MMQKLLPAMILIKEIKEEIELKDPILLKDLILEQMLEKFLDNQFYIVIFI